MTKFPYAQIPERAWSVPAKALLPYIPTPNQSGDVFSTSAYNHCRPRRFVAYKKGRARLGARL